MSWEKYLNTKDLPSPEKTISTTHFHQKRNNVRRYSSWRDPSKERRSNTEKRRLSGRTTGREVGTKSIGRVQEMDRELLSEWKGSGGTTEGGSTRKQKWEEIVFKPLEEDRPRKPYHPPGKTPRSTGSNYSFKENLKWLTAPRAVEEGLSAPGYIYIPLGLSGKWRE